MVNITTTTTTKKKKKKKEEKAAIQRIFRENSTTSCLTNLNKLEETLGTIVKDAEGLKQNQNSGGS